MRKLFSLILMLFMFVGITIATEVTPDVVTHQTEFVVDYSTDQDIAVFISDWVSDNFSSEVGEAALFPNSLEVIILNRPAGEILVTTNIPIDIIFTYTDRTIVTQYIESEVLTDFSISVSTKEINTKFAKDLKEWLQKMPQ